MRKRILSALLAVMFLFTGLPGTAWAVGEGNMEAGGGQTETVTGDSFWNGDWGIRFCVVDVASQTVVSATYDAANKSSGYENYKHYGKTNKFDYRNGAPLNGQIGTYGWNTPPVTIPTIVRTSGAPDIKAIKDYFTDETVIRWIGDVTGMAYDTLISGDYKLFIEPILYYTFDSQKYAMTATEAALFDRAINGLLLRTMGNATHQQLPLSLYLEKSDLGFSKWSGAKTGIQNDTNIINYLGMGIVSFIPEEEPEPGTGGNGDGPTVPISFRKTDPERFNAANYNTGLITFAPASSNSAAFDNISGAVIEISGDGTGAGTYELPCTVELGEGTFTVREVTPPYGYLLNDAWSAEITVEVEKDGEGKPVEGAEAEATITVSGGGGTDGTSYASVEDYRQRGQLTVTKVDNETISLNHGNYRTPQGDATFAGAVFELRAAKDIYLPSTWIKIYSEGDLVATAVTGNDGSFTINGIEQGVYTLQEITPSDGYVFQGAKARGQIYTITNAYTGSGTNILSFDDKAAGDTGNKNQYANTVIKADLTLTKFNENRTVENEMDGNAYEMNKQPAEGVYFAVYLNSKAAAGGNPIYSTTDDPVGDGTSGSASTAGWGYLDLVNHNFYSPLPDEWFKQRDLDANNPLPNGNPSVEEGRAEETDLARISMKDLYMVLRTDSTGRATTLDPSTVVYCSWGELGNSAANGTAGIDYRLPYGLYTVIELNPYEGREPDMFEVFIGRDPEAEPATAPTETKSGSGEDYPYTSGWYDFNYNYILENKTLKQTVTVRKTDAQSGKTIPAANTTYRIWSWDNISANGATEHPLRPYTRKIVAGDGTVTADTVVPPTVSMDYSSLTIAPGESAAAPELSLDFVGPAAVVLKDGTKAISWTEAEQAEIKTDFANAYAVYIADAGVAKAEQQTDGSWSIIGVAAGTTKYSVRLPGGQAITGTVKVADGAATATNSPVTWKVDGHWIHQTISYPNPHTLTDFKTDATGTFTMPDYLVYGDYLLYEIESPEGYVQAEPFAFTINKSDANNSKIYLTLNIKQADVPQKARIVFEKSGNLLVGAEAYKTLLSLNGLKPLWKIGLLAGGTTFEVYAAEDIATPEGTVYYTAGQLVETVKTDRTGMAQTSELELGHYTVKEVATTWGYLTDGEPIDVVLAYAGQAVTIYPKYLEVENIRQNVIFKVLKEAVTKNGNKPANDVYFGLYNAQSIYASADEAWIVMPRSNFIIKKGETVTLDIGLSSLIADEQVTVTVEKMANPDPAGKPIEVANVKNHDNRVFELIGTEVGSTTFVVSAAGLSIEGTIEVLAEDAELPDPMSEAKPASSMQDGENTLTMTIARTNYRLIAGKRVDERTDKLDVTFSEDAAQEYSVHVKDKSVAVYDPDSRCFFGVAAGSTTFTVQNTDGLVVEGTIEVLADPEAVTGDDLTGRSSGEPSTEAAAPETEKEDRAGAHTSEDEQATENTDGSQAEEGSPAEPPAVPAEVPVKLPAEPPAVPTDAKGDDLEPEPVIPAAEIPAAIPGTATKEKEAVLPKVLIPADSLLEVIRIKDGVGTSSLDLPLGSYYIRELKAPANYEYDPDQRWYFRFMYSPLAGTTVTVTANGGHVIVNKTDERPPVIIIPEEIGRMELHKPKGPNYSTTTNPGTGAGEPWEEAELIRERKTEDALINTYVFTSDREDDELQLAKKIYDGDVTWRLRGIDYLLLRAIPSGKRVEETVSFDSLDNKSVPETYTVTVDGEEIILQLEKADYTEHRSEGTQGYWSWDPITVTGTLYGSPTMTKYYLGDELIPYNDSAPVIGGYETAYLQYLGLNADNFRIKSGAWSGEWTTGSDGQSLRNVTFRCSRLTWHEGNPAVTYYSAEAVYSNGLTDGPERYEIQATATYTPSRAAVVAAAVGGTGAIVVCAFLWIRLNNARFFDPDGRPIGRGRVKRTRTADTVLIGKAKYRLVEIEEDRLDEE